MNQKVQSHNKYSVVLHCTKTNKSEVNNIRFESPPVNTSDIMEQIEKQFSIPVCVQVLSFEGCTLKGSNSLSALRVREGDTFRIEYLAKGNCSELMDIISWLEQLLKAVASNSDFIDITKIRNLRSFFSPRSDPTSKTYVNKLYFVSNGGFEMIMKIYEFLLQKPWKNMKEIFKYLEHFIIRLLWSLAHTYPLCHHIVQHNAIPMLTKSLLRVRLEEGKKIPGISSNGYHHSHIVQTILCSTGVLINLVELLPECQLEIATSRDILCQVSCFSISPLIPTRFSRRSAILFAYLAFNSQTHQYIAKSAYVHHLLQACRKPTSDLESKALLEYYTLLFLMQVCLISPHCVMSDWYKDITSMMEAFLQANSYKEIRDLEITHHTSSLIFLPYVKLAYVPYAPPQAEETNIGRLQLVSLRLAIFSLQDGLGRECQRQTLLKEGLLDFVICMPQYVPPSLRPQAEELVQMVVSSPDIPEGPPKLLNLVKARLAKMHFGLELVLTLSVSEIVSKTLTVCGSVQR